MSKKSQFLFWICILCTLGSIAAHVYLTNHHYSLKYGSLANESLCNINETFNCNKTTMSTYSEVFGVPIAIFGALTHFVLFCLLLGARFPIVKPKTQESLESSVKIMTLGIFFVSLVMGSLSYFALNTICPMCSVSYVLSLILVVCSWLYFRGLNVSMSQVKILGSASLAILIFGFFFHHNSLRKYGGKELQEITRLQLQQWRQSPVQDMKLVSPLTLHKSSEAKVQIVEFADFLCGHCAQAFPIVHQFAKLHPDVEFAFQAFPLDGECNSAIGRATGLQCFLARVSQCSSEQDKTWETQRWMFENQSNLLSKEAFQREVQQFAPTINLDVDRLMACTDSEATRAAIKGQADLGVAIGVTGTPSVYINGKKVPAGFNQRLLEKIYNEALKSAK